jgi:non-haem Fe2+, alpha-ketoglutarate-dependent halogenase
MIEPGHGHFFAEHGFLGPLPLLEPAEVLAYREVVSRLEAGREVGAIDQIRQPHLRVRSLWRLATDARLLDLVEAALGTGDLLLAASAFMTKYPDPSSADGVGLLPWHQDLFDWHLEPPRVLGAWVALDDCDVENGCLRVVPGSHKLGLLPQGREAGGGEYQEVSAAPVERAVDLEHPAGSVSLHHCLTVHSSHGNRSARRRCGFAMRFTAAEVRVLPGAHSANRHHPVLVRGSGASSGMRLEDPPPFAQGAEGWGS